MQSSSNREPSIDNEESEERKFTIGEKCIFIHLVATFSIILFLVCVYFTHLLVVKHSHLEAFQVSSWSYNEVESKDIKLEKMPVGLVYIQAEPVTMMCNSVLLRAKWSAAPGHCVAARTEPELSAFLHFWRVKYKHGGHFTESDIKRTIPHPHFDRSYFSNNIGLIEHDTAIDNVRFYAFPSPGLKLNDETIEKYPDQMLIVGWRRNAIGTQDGPLSLHYSYVQPVSTSKCSQFMSPIVELREYEYCVILDKKTDGDTSIFPDHGAVLVVATKIVGIFTWGEKSGNGAPSIILDYTHFQNWTENIFSW